MHESFKLERNSYLYWEAILTIRKLMYEIS
jgi:hypothetical protein